MVPEKSLFDEIADAMARSLTVGPHCTRAEILVALHRRFATEEELRTYLDATEARVKTFLAHLQSIDRVPVLVIPIAGDHSNQLKH